MEIERLREFLLWNAVINYGVLIAWFLAFLFVREALFRMNTRWFRLAPERFDALHYGGMAVYKIGILLLNLTPLIALCLVR
jgi:hypothetical protein